MPRFNWEILATGNTARAFARAVARSRTGKLMPVGNRTQESANEFGAAFR